MGSHLQPCHGPCVTAQGEELPTNSNSSHKNTAMTKTYTNPSPCEQTSCYKVPVLAVLKAFAFVPLTIFFSNEKNERQEGKGSKDGILWSVARAFSVPGTRLVGTSWEAQGWKTPRGSWVWASRHTQPCSFGICTIPDGGIPAHLPK